MPATAPELVSTYRRRAALIAVGYLAAMQLLYAIIPFTTETLWLWAFGLIEAVEFGRVGPFLLDPEWWLALVHPVAILLMGWFAGYSMYMDANPIPAIIAGGYLLGFIVSEVVFGMELALLFILAAPIGAILCVGVHFGWRFV